MAAVVAVVAGCSGGPPARAGETTTVVPPNSTAPPTTVPVPDDALPPADPARPAQIVTPGEDVPNPFVLVDGGRYYLYASQIGIYSPAIPVRVSDRPDAWPPQASAVDALPHIPDWAQWGLTWAPDVRKVGDHYVMWFTSLLRYPDPTKQCIGVAQAATPLGPFQPADKPIVCQLDRGGSIDPRSFVDRDGSLWLVWKSDDNSDVDGTSHSSIYSQHLAADGMSLVGARHRILDADQPWEGRIVEAPQLWRHNGDYWLFYSANWFNQPVYSIGVAHCDGPAGPCTKPFDRAWLATNDQGAGPGEGSLFTDLDGRIWILYAPRAQQYRTVTPRPVAMARVAFAPKGPYLAMPPRRR